MNGQGGINFWNLFKQAVQSEFTRWREPSVGLDPAEEVGDQDWLPPLEVFVLPDCYKVFVELPGVEDSMVHLSATATCLTVSGQKLPPSVETADSGAAEAIVSQRAYGSFRRRIMLPGAIHVDRMEAALKDGVLAVTAPKAEESEPVSIRVEAD